MSPTSLATLLTTHPPRSPSALPAVVHHLLPTAAMEAYSFDPYAGAEDEASDLSFDGSVLAVSDDDDASSASDCASASSASGEPSARDGAATASSTSASSPASSSSSASSSSASSEWLPGWRERARAGLTRPTAVTQARDGGFASVDDMRFRTALRLQHTLRIPDRAFVLGGHSPLSRQRWTAWRKQRFLASASIQPVLPLVRVPKSRVRGAATGIGRRGGGDAAAADDAADDDETIMAYRAIAAASYMPEVLLGLVLSHANYTEPCVAVQVCGDGVNGAAPGCPDRGKIFSMYLKPMFTIDPQSPRWLIPFLTSLGSDRPATLHAVFSEISLSSIIEDLPTTRYGPRRTFIVLIFIGDFPACCAMTDIGNPARQYPTTPGRIPAWRRPICWHCGIAPLEMYHARLGHAWRARVADQESRVAGISSVIGIVLWLIFYEVVHAVNVSVQALLADIALFYQTVTVRRGLHPVAAYIHGLFPASGWDVFLTQPSSRSKERRSRKPLCAVDPDVTWSWLTDPAQQQPFLALLESHPIPLDCESIGAGTLDHGPMMVWSSYTITADAWISGKKVESAAAGSLTEDIWRVMNTVSTPPVVACALPPDEAPTFFNPIVAYGPASHIAFCSMPRYIEAVDDACPRWRTAGITFAKFAAGVHYEHGMKRVRSDYSDFGTAARLRRTRAVDVLERAVERATLRAVIPDFDPPCAPANQTNRVYKDIPLSKRVPMRRSWKDQVTLLVN